MIRMKNEGKEKRPGLMMVVSIKVSKNGTLPGLRPIQIGIGSHRERFWT